MRSERYSTEREIKSTLCTKEDGVGGAVLYREGGKNYIYGGEQHCMYLGVSGAGKTRSGTLPLTRSIIDADESALIVDPKGDIFSETAEYAKEKGYEVKALNLRDIFSSDKFNVLSYPYRLYTSGNPRERHLAETMINELGENLFPENANDPFWPLSARTLFKGAVTALFECGREDEINIASVCDIIIKGDKRFASDTYLGQLAEKLNSNAAKMNLFGYTNTASDTKGCVRYTFIDGLSVFSKSEAMVDFFSIDDIFIEDFDGSKKFIMYIILPDETNIFNTPCGVLLSQFMTHFVRIAHEKHGGKLPVRLNIILEELFSIGSAISNLPQILSSSRSRNIRVHYVLQSISQLTDVYGQSKAQTIIGNTDIIIAFRTNNPETLSYLSSICGERVIEYNGSFVKDALISPSQLAAMKTGQALVLIGGKIKFVTWLPDYTEMFECVAHAAPEIRPDRALLKANVFDVIEYVKEKKRQEMLLGTEEPPVRNICTPKIDFEPDFGKFLDEQMARIDEQIRMLDEMEKAEKKKKKTTPPHLINEVIVIAADDKKDTVNAVAKASNLPKNAVKEKLEKMPATFYFEDRERAEAVEKAITESGGIAIVKRTKKPKEV